MKKKNLKLSLKNIKKFIIQLKDILPRLNFNKITGLFEFEFEFDMQKNKKLITFADSKTNNILELDVIDSGSSSDYKYTECGECCVCYDETLTKTSCSHFLCIECWSNIKNMDCPYCRHKKIKFN